MRYSSVVSVVLTTCVCASTGRLCTTPNQTPGECKSIFNCQSLLGILNNAQRTSQDAQLLKRSQCGFEGSTPMVCCSSGAENIPQNGCVNPDGKPGICIDIYACEHLAAMLQPPVSQRSVNYITQSKCLGQTNYNVCCGPEELQTTMPGVQEFQRCQDTISSQPPEPFSECCGHDTHEGNKIFGEATPIIDQNPWLALIEYESNGKTRALCGGSLISGRYVLTSARCVTSEGMAPLDTPKTVRLGEYNKSKDGPDCELVEAGGLDCTDGEVRIPVQLTIPHPEYRAPGHTNDIALIRLAHLAPFTDFIRPICLPSTDVTLNPAPNITVSIAGWGTVDMRYSSSNIKMHLDVPLVNHEQCQKAYNVAGLNITLLNNKICAGGVEDKDSCKGDPGGPLMYKNGKLFEVIGVVSFGAKSCGKSHIPGVYTKVYDYKDWILSNIKP